MSIFNNVTEMTPLLKEINQNRPVFVCHYVLASTFSLVVCCILCFKQNPMSYLLHTAVIIIIIIIMNILGA